MAYSHSCGIRPLQGGLDNEMYLLGRPRSKADRVLVFIAGHRFSEPVTVVRVICSLSETLRLAGGGLRYTQDRKQCALNYFVLFILGLP